MNFKKLAIAIAVALTFSLSSIAPVAQLAPVQQAMAQAAATPDTQKAAGAAAGCRACPGQRSAAPDRAHARLAALSADLGSPE